jgi:hypothetical protein
MSPEATKAFKAKMRAEDDLRKYGAPVITPGQRAYQAYYDQRNGVNSAGQAALGWSQLTDEMRLWWEHTGIQPPGTPPWWQSKVFWFNALVLAAAAAEEHLGMLQGVLPGSVFAWVAFGLPVANKAIRAYQVWRAVP